MRLPYFLRRKKILVRQKRDLEDQLRLAREERDHLEVLFKTRRGR